MLVGGSTTIGNYLLPAVLGSFAKRYPKTRVELQVGNTQQIALWLEQGDHDIAFIEGPCHSRGLVSSHWRDDELVVVTGPEHPWIKDKIVTPARLASATWIMREKDPGTREIMRMPWRKLASAIQYLWNLVTRRPSKTVSLQVLG